MKRHLVAIQVTSNFEFFFKQIDLGEYFEKALAHHSGASLPIFDLCGNKFGFFEKALGRHLDKNFPI